MDCRVHILSLLFLLNRPTKSPKMSGKLFDALIVGAGPGGLAAALALGRLCRTAIVFDSGQFRNANVKAMHTVPSRDGANPREFREIAKSQITAKYTTISFRYANIMKSGRLELDDGYQGYQLVDSESKLYTGRKLILATGTEDVLPDIPGYSDNWPSHMYVFPR